MNARRLLSGAAALAALALASPHVAHAGIVWFNEADYGPDQGSFLDLASAYQSFMGESEATIGFSELTNNTKLSDQYADAFGVTFANTGAGHSGVRKEGDGIVESFTGYDGSYMPDKDHVYGKFDNDRTDTPFTILFDEPVASLGAFVGMGVEGAVHTLAVSLFDAADAVIGVHTVNSWLWDDTTKKQNYESFFGFHASDALIARVEILNNAQTNYANGLTIDNIAFSHTVADGVVPEPQTAAGLALGLVLLLRRRA